jgi:hypothetical protein
MGVFDTLPLDGSGMSAKELSDKLHVDEALLGEYKNNHLKMRTNSEKYA